MAQAPREKPRSISDQARDVYAEKLRRETELFEQAKAAAAKLAPDWDRHPDLAESLIPVWGSAREAVADLHDGDGWGFALNGALALTDLTGGWAAKSVAKTMAKTALGRGSKVGLKGGMPDAWRYARKRMGEDGFLAKGQHGHHWLIPQKGWGTKFPEKVKNHPLNIMPMPNNPQGIKQHNRLHHGVGEKKSPERLERFNPLQRYIYGTPTWAKAASVAAVGHPAGAAKAEWDKSK